jgi:hypothetical protein
LVEIEMMMRIVFPYWFDCRNDGVNLCISSS